MTRFLLISSILFLCSCKSVNIISIYIDRTTISADKIEKILNAATTWENASNGEIIFNFKTANNLQSYKNRISTIKISKEWKESEKHKQAITTSYFKYGRIVESDIILNGKYFNFKEVDFESLILHELGHVLGLGHESNGVMNEFLPKNTIRRNLMEQDLILLENLLSYL